LQGAATDARITGIEDITVVVGSGQLWSVTPMPMDLGLLAPNTNVAREPQFNWPESATRLHDTHAISIKDTHAISIKDR
jgi:hypothetical protein